MIFKWNWAKVFTSVVNMIWEYKKIAPSEEEQLNVWPWHHLQWCNALETDDEWSSDWVLQDLDKTIHAIHRVQQQQPNSRMTDSAARLPSYDESRFLSSGARVQVRMGTSPTGSSFSAPQMRLVFESTEDAWLHGFSSTICQTHE